MKPARDLEPGDVIQLDPNADYILPENKRAIQCYLVIINHIVGWVDNVIGWADNYPSPDEIMIYSKILPLPQPIPSNVWIETKDLTGFKNVEFE